MVNSAKQGKKVVEDIVGPLKTKYKKKLYAEKLKSETVEKPKRETVILAPLISETESSPVKMDVKLPEVLKSSSKAPAHNQKSATKIIWAILMDNAAEGIEIEVLVGMVLVKGVIEELASSAFEKLVEDDRVFIMDDVVWPLFN